MEDCMRKLVSIVIPCYRSAEMIGGVVADINREMETLQEKYRWEIILVNDCSPDLSLIHIFLLVGDQNFIVTNQAYFRMGIAYERAYAYYNRIMMRIEATEGYIPGQPFALIGEYGLSETPDLLGSYSPVSYTHLP